MLYTHTYTILYNKPVPNRLTELNSNPVPSQGTPGVGWAEAGGRRTASAVVTASATAGSSSILRTA